MKRKIAKSIIILGIIILINISFSTISKAELRLSVSKSTVAPRETFNVIVSVDENEAAVATLNVSNANLNVSRVDLMSQNSVSLICSAGETGVITINASGMVARYDTETEEKQATSLTVNIEDTTLEPTPDPDLNLSDDTSLSSLSISPFGVIKIASSGIYDITVDNSLESVTITGIPNNSKATVISGNGVYNLEDGTNVFAVVVRAEDGSEQSHRIRIIRKPAGTVDKVPTILGDINSDGIINTLDAILVLQHISHKFTLTYTEKSLADTSKDGVINTLDAIKILQYVSHKITKF